MTQWQIIQFKKSDSACWSWTSAKIASLVGSNKVSKRRNTTIGKMISRYLPRTYTSRKQSSAIDQIKETNLL